MAKPSKPTRHARDFNVAVGACLKAQRIALGYGTAEIAQYLQIPEKDVWHFEKGVSAPSIYAFSEICELFCIDVDSMLIEIREAHAAVLVTS